MADNKDFVSRLNKACDEHPLVPEHGHGRQTWLRAKLQVSNEAVRKWFAGEARPRPGKMKMLARVLEVDEAWLSLGMSPDLSPKERRVRNATADGAVNVVTGLIQMNGGHCAFPDPKDPRAGYVDLYAIVGGTQMAIHVCLALALDTKPESFRFMVPSEFEECTVIGVVQTGPLTQNFIQLRPDLIEKHGVRGGAGREIVVTRSGARYCTNKDEWPKMQSLTTRIAWAA